MISKKLIKFGSAGVINTGVDWVIYFFLTNTLHTWVTTAKVAGSVGGVTSAFLLNALWVFRENFVTEYKKHHYFTQRTRFVATKYLQLVTVYSVGMVFNVLAFTICMKLGIMEIVSLIFATGCSFLVNFFLSKKFVFNANPLEEDNI